MGEGLQAPSPEHPRREDSGKAVAPRPSEAEAVARDLE